MKKLACLAMLSMGLTVMGCASSEGEDEGTSEDALTALTAAKCKTPVVHTAPKASPRGGPLAGSAHTTLAGCIVGSRGETGDAVLTRLAALLNDTAHLATIKDSSGAPVFKRFTAGTRRGTLVTSLTQDLDVTLAMDHSPYTRLRAVQRKPSSGQYSLELSNSQALLASVAFFTVTVVNPGDLSLTLQVKAEQNGITVTGASDIVLQQQQDQAASASVLVTDLFRWLTTELAKSAPPPAPAAPPP